MQNIGDIYENVSIHAPRVGRDAKVLKFPQLLRVSIHAPRVGRDGSNPVINPTAAYVSIHAPRVGRDLRGARSGGRHCSFNPRAPRGARRPGHCIPHSSIGVSIHAPRVGRDSRRWRWRSARIGFNPRAPRGARPGRVCRSLQLAEFQSTRPAWGATIESMSEHSEHIVSIHAPRVGRDRLRTLARCRAASFNPRAPRGARRFCF